MTKPAAPDGDERLHPDQIVHLSPRDVMRIDPEPLARLQAALGPQGAEDVVCRALEDISHRLRRMADQQAAGQADQICRAARSIAAVATQIGLRDLAVVAGHVADCAARNDRPGLAATLARLFRVGKRAVTEIGQVRFSGY